MGHKAIKETFYNALKKEYPNIKGILIDQLLQIIEDELGQLIDLTVNEALEHLIVHSYDIPEGTTPPRFIHEIGVYRFKERLVQLGFPPEEIPTIKNNLMNHFKGRDYLKELGCKFLYNCYEGKQLLIVEVLE